MSRIDDYFQGEAALLSRIPPDPVARAVAILAGARSEGRRVFIFGNGGSAATASHFVVDMLKGIARPGRPPLRIIGLNDNVSILTAQANDVSYETVFSVPLAALAEPADVAIGISASGNSANVLAAMATARERGLVTIGLTGYAGGKLKDAVDCPIIVPSNSMQQIEDTHLVILHAIFVELRDQ